MNPFRFIAVIALLCASTLVTLAKDRHVWGLTKSGGETILFYGVPESHAVTLLFNCKSGKPLSIVSTVLPPRSKKAQALKIELRNGSLAASFDGVVGGNEEDGYHVAAETEINPQVVEVLRSGVAVTVAAGGYKERVPLRGVAKPLAQFEAGCFGKR